MAVDIQPSAPDISISNRITDDVVNRASQVWSSSAQAEWYFLPSPCTYYIIFFADIFMFPVVMDMN